MDTVGPSAERRVYLTCRAIFTGQNAQLRKQKKIREVVDNRSPDLGPLIADFGVPGLVDILKSLLDERVFESELRAKVKFPGLFLSSPERDIQRAESEIHAAKSVAEALEEIGSLDQPQNGLDEDEDQPWQRLSEPREVVPQSPSVGSANDNLISLYPSYLPYTAQHIILTTAQRVLEECCFDFARTWQPSILRDNGWDCAAAGELTKWTRVLSKHSGKLPINASALSEGSSLNSVLFSTHKLRHSAVHRLPTTARGVSQLIESAQKMTEILQDHPRAAQLEELRCDVDSKIKAMELNKNVLEDELNRELQEICQRRKELDEKEEGLRARVIADDLVNKLLIGSLLEETVRRIFCEDCEDCEEVELDPVAEKYGDKLEVQNDVVTNGLEKSTLLH